MGLAYEENSHAGLMRERKLQSYHQDYILQPQALALHQPYNLVKWPMEWEPGPTLAKCSIITPPPNNPFYYIDPKISANGKIPNLGSNYGLVAPEIGREKAVKMRPKERPYSCNLDPRIIAPGDINKLQQEAGRTSQRASLDKISQYVLDKNSQTLYIKGKLLGKGGFAKCYKFTDLTNNTEFAAKIITKSQLVKMSHKEQVGREIEIHKTLSHVNIVRLHSYFEDDTNLYIILEYCDNKTLVDLIKLRGVLSEGETRYFMRQILFAVSYLHALNILHRDLKLGNMFLTRHYQIKVGDFGLSSRIQDHSKKVSICGTPNYIAPEILQKTGHGFPADIWALGCIMYAMLVGKPPFESDSLRETYHRISKNLYRIPDNLSTLAKDLVSKLLIAQPSLRINLETASAHTFFNERNAPNGNADIDIRSNRHELHRGANHPNRTIDLSSPSCPAVVSKVRGTVEPLRKSISLEPEKISFKATSLGISADNSKKKRYSGVICNEHVPQVRATDWLDTYYCSRIEKCDKLNEEILEKNRLMNPSRYQQVEAEIGVVRRPKIRRYSMVNGYPSGPIFSNNYAIAVNGGPQIQTKPREQKLRPISMIYPMASKSQEECFVNCLCSGKANNKSSVNNVKKFFKPLDPKKIKTTLVQWVTQVKRQKTRKESKDKPASIVTDGSDSNLSITKPRSRSILIAKPRMGINKNDRGKGLIGGNLADGRNDCTKRYSCSIFGDKYENSHHYPNKDVSTKNSQTQGESINQRLYYPEGSKSKRAQGRDVQKDAIKYGMAKQAIALACQETDFSCGSSTNSSSVYPSSNSCLDKSSCGGDTPLKKEESHSSGIVCPSPSSHGSSQPEVVGIDTSLEGQIGCEAKANSFKNCDTESLNFIGLEKAIKGLIDKTCALKQQLYNKAADSGKFSRSNVPPMDHHRFTVNLEDFLNKGIWHHEDDSSKKKIIWVTKWIDYTEKYGFGYQLSDGLRAVIFNDGSRIQKTPDNRVIIYDEHNFVIYDAYLSEDLNTRFLPNHGGNTNKDTRFTVMEKVSILFYFSDFMERNLIEGGDLPLGHAVKSYSGRPVGTPLHKYYVRDKWFVRREAKSALGLKANTDPENTYALVMYLNCGVVQINFLTDHTKLIFGDGCACPMTRRDPSPTNPWMIFIDSNRQIYAFPNLLEEGGVVKMPGWLNSQAGDHVLTTRVRRQSLDALSELEEKFRFASTKVQDLIKMNEFDRKVNGFLI